MNKKIAVLTICFALIFGTGIYYATAERFNDNYIQGEYVEGVVMVGFHENSQPEEINRIKQDLNAELKVKYKLIRAEVWDISGMEVEEAILKYKDDPAIEYIEPDYIYYADETSTDDPYLSDQWGLDNYGQTGGTTDADIDALSAWDIRTESNVIVAVIDGGIDYTHPDLADNMWTNPGEINGDGVDNDGNGYIDDYYGWDFYNNDNDPLDTRDHGTHVAGIIGAVGNNGTGVTGVSWTNSLMAVQVCSGTSSACNSSAMVSGLEYSVLMGAKISNNSYGGGSYSTTMLKEIVAARTAGCLFITSAGNDYGNDNDLYPHYPSNYNVANVISVASVDHDDQLAAHSNFGATTVDLGAPGEDIYSTEVGSYGNKTGTSMATPFVAGAASLVWSHYPSYSYAEIKTLILDSVDPVSSLSGLVSSDGRLNLANMFTCDVPSSGDWTVSESCLINSTETAPENVLVDDGVSLIITNGNTLDMDLSSYHLNIGNGSRVVIEEGAKID